MRRGQSSTPDPKDTWRYDTDLQMFCLSEPAELDMDHIGFQQWLVAHGRQVGDMHQARYLVWDPEPEEAAAA